MANRLAGAATVPVVPDTVLDSIAIEAGVIVTPDNTRQLTATFLTAGGRALSLTADSWEIDDGTFSIDATGLVTTPVTEGVTAARARKGALVSNDCVVTCALYDGRSALAKTVLDGIRPGLSDSILNLTIGHVKPGINTPSTTPGITTFNSYPSYPVANVVDVASPYGNSWTEPLPAGFNLGDGVEGLTISAVTRGPSTLLTIVENVHDSIDADVRYLAGYNLSIGVAIAGYNGGSFITIPGATGPEGSVGFSFEIIDDHTLKLHPLGDLGTDWDSSAWDAYVPGDNPAHLHWFAGTGNTHITLGPETLALLGQTTCCRVVYLRWLCKHPSGYPTGTQGMKGLEISHYVAPGYFNAFYAPWHSCFDYLTDPTSRITPNAVTYSANWFNGLTSDPNGGGKSGPFYSDVTPDVHAVFETIIRFPRNRGDIGTIWNIMDGVLQIGGPYSLGSPPSDGTSGNFRQVNTVDGVEIEFAYRFGGIDLNETDGGGGHFFPILKIRYVGELLVAGGWVNDDEKPDHIDVSIDTAGPYHANDLIQVRGVLKDSTNVAIDQCPAWLDAYVAGSEAAAAFIANGTHGEVQEGIKKSYAIAGSTEPIPEFVVPMRLSSFVGNTTIQFKLRQWANGTFTGVETTGSVNLTVIP